jgi:6-phosphogluconolactonase
MVGTMKNPRIIAFPDMEQFYDSATAFVVDHLQAIGASGQRTTLFLSGGSTPGTIYKRLSNANLDWATIDVAQVDDRWVSLEDPGSNATMIKNTLLKKRAKSAPFSRIKSRHKSAKAGQSSVEASYQKLTIKGSLAVLGMGPDGHVCSWFPDAVGLEASLDPANDSRVQAITAKPSKVTGPYLERMTLTLSALVECESLLLLITGEVKKRVLQTAINDRACGLPVRHLLDAVGDRLTVMSAE